MPRFKQTFHLLIFLWLSACESLPYLSPEEVLIDRGTANYNTENVIIISIDGPRYSETWGHPQQQFIPRQAENLSPLGVSYAWFYNQGPTYTVSGHTALTTGRYQVMQNDGSEFPRAPSIFQLWLNQTGMEPRKAQIIASKSKLSVLGDCSDIHWRGKFNPVINTADREDKETLEMALRVLSIDQPYLALIHFKGPDTEGHADNWEGYLKSIMETDQYVWEIWQHIQYIDQYLNATTLFVTNDHGRHLDHIKSGFTGHGDYCEGCLHIGFLAWGPDFKRAITIDQPRELIDVAPTIATLLGFETPNPQGSPLVELLKE